MRRPETKPRRCRSWPQPHVCGNDFIHHVNWAFISVDGQERERWKYSWRKLPESGTFEREIKIVVDAPVTITAQADCNLHGNKGPATATINVTE